MSRRLLWTFVAIGTMLSLAVAGRIASRQLVFGSAEGGWVYGYVDSVHGRWFLFFVISSALAAAAVWMSWPSLVRLGRNQPAAERVRAWTLILAWCLLALAIQGLLRSLTPHSFEALFASDTSNSFYSVASRLDGREILGEFERRRGSWPLHAKSNLPGKLLLVRGLVHVSEHPGTLAWLVVALSNFGALLLYVFVRDLFDDRHLAALSAILYLFTPAKFYFFPLLNTVTPVVVLACAVFLLRWLNTGRRVYAALLGAAVYGLILFEPTALMAGGLFAMVLARAIIVGRMSGRSAIAGVAMGIAAFVATYAAMGLWCGFDLIAAFRDVAADAVAFNVEARRPYGIWLRQNVVDFAFGAGLCQIVLLGAALADGIIQLKAPARPPSAATIVLVAAAIVAMVCVAVLAGINRGEVIRLWIFLACLAQIPAAYICWRLSHPMAIAAVLTMTFLQGAMGTAMVAFAVP